MVVERRFVSRQSGQRKTRLRCGERLLFGFSRGSGFPLHTGHWSPLTGMRFRYAYLVPHASETSSTRCQPRSRRWSTRCFFALFSGEILVKIDEPTWSYPTLRSSVFYRIDLSSDDTIYVDSLLQFAAKMDYLTFRNWVYQVFCAVDRWLRFSLEMRTNRRMFLARNLVGNSSLNISRRKEIYR